ncbi:MAG: hypothetical protein CO068_12130 [Flavobacteriaceae bacterium CG_4_9_14_0_8_um_filter_34_30]|nr:MAG: hypothetical protein CO068_12130 [Flavobacteriaceae bacterium CG_4_9_14_0_8_um_filter_34_30]
MKNLFVLALIIFVLNGCLVPPSPVHYKYTEVNKNSYNKNIISIKIRNVYLRHLPKNNFDIVSTLILKNTSNKVIAIDDYNFTINSSGNEAFEINSIEQMEKDTTYTPKGKILYYKNKKEALRLPPNKNIHFLIIHNMNVNIYYKQYNFRDLKKIEYTIELNNEKNQFEFHGF